MKNILILGGGGSRASFLHGAIRSLSNEFSPDMIFGLSAGAIVGAAFAGGMDRDTMHDMFAKTSIWNLNRMIQSGVSMIDMPKKIKVAVQAVNADTAARELFWAHNVDKETYLRSIVASSSHPLFSKPVKMNGAKFIDGGVWDSVPFQTAIPFISHGDKVVVISTQPLIQTEKMKTRIGDILRWRRLSKLGKTPDDIYPTNFEISLIQPQGQMPPKWMGGKRVADKLFRLGYGSKKIETNEHFRKQTD